MSRTFSATLRNVPTLIHLAKRTKVLAPISKNPPRTHDRRLMEEVVKPILPETSDISKHAPSHARCRRPLQEKINAERRKTLNEEQLAYKNHLRDHLLRAVAVAVCHEHPSDRRIKQQDVMELSYNGVAYIKYDNKIITSLLENSTLSNLSGFFGENMSTALVFTKMYIKEEDDGRMDFVSRGVSNRQYLRTLIQELAKAKWLLPLAYVYEDRILNVNDATAVLNMIKNPLEVRAQTASILLSSSINTSSLLSQHSVQLSSNLEARVQQLQAEDDSKPQ